jgi:hypothetical protein
MDKPNVPVAFTRSSISNSIGHSIKLRLIDAGSAGPALLSGIKFDEELKVLPYLVIPVKA